MKTLRASGVRRRLARFGSQRVENEEYRAAADRDIGDVESGPVIAGGVEIEIVDDGPERDAIDHVAERAAENKGEREAEPGDENIRSTESKGANA